MPPAAAAEMPTAVGSLLDQNPWSEQDSGSPSDLEMWAMPSETQEQEIGETESAKQNANASGAACPAGRGSRLETERPEEKEKERVEDDPFSCLLSAGLFEPAGNNMTVTEFCDAVLAATKFCAAVLAATKFSDLSAACAPVRMTARFRF